MKTLYPLAFFLLCIACSPTKNINSSKIAISEQIALTNQFIQRIDSVDQMRITKLQAGELDETTDSITKAYLHQLRDTLTVRLSYFNALTSNKIVRKNKKQVLEKLNHAKSSYSVALENVYLLDDLFNTSTFSRLNTATFFASGNYQLSDSATADALAPMQTICKEALNFSARHANKNLQAIFIVLGYADEQNISPGSELYKDLISNMSGSNPGRKQLNAELSQRRAISIKNLLKAQYQTLSPSYGANSLSSSFVATGKGEQLPAGNNINYQPIDDRRRVVLLYWSILPVL